MFCPVKLYEQAQAEDASKVKINAKMCCLTSPKSLGIAIKLLRNQKPLLQTLFS